MPPSSAISLPPALSLADFADASLVVPELRERDMAGVIKELTQVLHTQGWVQDVLPFYNAALTREYLSSTATGGGLAFPHARSNSDDRLRFAFGRSPQPVAWGAPCTTAVRFVFVVVAPVTDTSRYLHLLSGLARLAKTESLLADLIGAQNSAQILTVLGKIPLHLPAAQQCAVW